MSMTNLTSAKWWSFRSVWIRISWCKAAARARGRFAAALSVARLVLEGGNRLPGTLDRIKRLAHGLSGAGGIYGVTEISDAAVALEDAVIAELADPGPGEATDLVLLSQKSV